MMKVMHTFLVDFYTMNVNSSDALMIIMVGSELAGPVDFSLS